jgi:hypothetical protein
VFSQICNAAGDELSRRRRRAQEHEHQAVDELHDAVHALIDAVDGLGVLKTLWPGPEHEHHLVDEYKKADAACKKAGTQVQLETWTRRRDEANAYVLNEEKAKAGGITEPTNYENRLTLEAYYVGTSLHAGTSLDGGKPLNGSNWCYDRARQVLRDVVGEWRARNADSKKADSKKANSLKADFKKANSDVTVADAVRKGFDPANSHVVEAVRKDFVQTCNTLVATQMRKHPQRRKVVKQLARHPRSGVSIPVNQAFFESDDGLAKKIFAGMCVGYPGLPNANDAQWKVPFGDIRGTRRIGGTPSTWGNVDWGQSDHTKPKSMHHGRTFRLAGPLIPAYYEAGARRGHARGCGGQARGPPPHRGAGPGRAHIPDDQRRRRPRRAHWGGRGQAADGHVWLCGQAPAPMDKRPAELRHAQGCPGGPGGGWQR